MEKINQLRIQIWLKEISFLSGENKIYALASLLDPKSIWRDEDGVPHQSKWYKFAKLKSVPSKLLDISVKQQLPNMVFELHHPAWSLMNQPLASRRTLNRMVAKMPKQWKQSLEQILQNTFEFRAINTELLTSLDMFSYSYLDAFMLFEVARKNSLGKDPYKANNLTYVQLALPLVYVDDPVWRTLDGEQRKIMLKALDNSMDITSTNVRFPVAERLRAEGTGTMGCHTQPVAAT